MLATFIALDVGTTALVARFRGRNNRHNAELVAIQPAILSLVATLLLTIPGVLFSRSMVLYMGSDQDTVEASAW
jgi:Na+-driven multidrug efflux pump